MEIFIGNKEHQISSAFYHTLGLKSGTSGADWPALNPPNGPLTLIRYMNQQLSKRRELVAKPRYRALLYYALSAYH